MENDKLACDPQGLYFEAYRMENISVEECRSIFLDWALSSTGGAPNDIKALYSHYGADKPDHPMTGILKLGLKQITPQRRKRR